ncbi:MAG: hypothetical protein AAF541_09370 [Pseudomonadota bacterium]
MKNLTYGRAILLGLATLLLGGGCGGGGGGSAGDAQSGTTSPPEPTRLSVIDSTPDGSGSTVDATRAGIRFVHPGFADLRLSNSGACVSDKVARRDLTGLANSEFDALFEHVFDCSPLTSNQSVEVEKRGERGGVEYVVSHDFTHAGMGSGELVGLGAINVSPAEIASSFQSYLTGELFNELDLPFDQRLLVVAAAIEAIAGWTNLSDPQTTQGVVARRVSYPAADPFGAATSAVTGLVVSPAVASTSPRRGVVVLAHSTGSTPGDLELSNAWYLLANLLASHGYLVVAADNWGRGGTSEFPETYLLGFRTAQNNINLVRSVVRDDDFAQFLPGGTVTPLILVGYSQGGHSVMGIWHQLSLSAASDLEVIEIYAGGGPYNLYSTFNGVMQFLSDNCIDDAYCINVDEAVTVPFATNRILPGVLEYTESGYTLDDIVSEGDLATDFIDDYSSGDASADSLKMLLQLNSYTNITNLIEVYAPAAQLHLYHAPQDLLVPYANQIELTALFSGHVSTTTHEDICSGTVYEAIATVTDVVGVIHSICGIAMVNHVVGQLR